MSTDLVATIRNASKKMATSIEVRKRRKIVRDFAEKVGLVYFGFVDQKTDDHKMVRGFTASASHQDDNYCIGTYRDYSVSFVDRRDAVWQPDGSIEVINWLILAIDLKTKSDMPHFMIQSKNDNNKSFVKFTAANYPLKEFQPGTLEDYGVDFTSRFTMYTKPTDSIEVERLIPAKTARVLGAHFWPLSIEMWDGVLYIYSSNKHVTIGLLNTILENGLWLAHDLDTQSVNI